MCGISAVFGEYAIAKSIYMTLNQLERGTMGCGVAYTYNNKIVVVKEPIHPIAFAFKHMNKMNINVNLAIAHNRLPSAGAVSYVNTHPFTDCYAQFALAHNGHAIRAQIKKNAMRDDHVMLGETDSEVLTHILEELLLEHGDMVEALKELMDKYLTGAIVVITKNNELYACKCGHYPLHYAVCNDEVYVASTKYAIACLLHTLGADGVEIEALEEGYVLSVRDGGMEVKKVLEPRVALPFEGVREYLMLYGFSCNFDWFKQFEDY